MINKLRKYDNYIIFAIIFVVSLGIGLCMVIQSGDEIWNFNNAYKIFNGYKMYKDINIIITPVFFYAINIFFHLFGANILVFRIAGIIMFSFLCLLIYCIFKEMGIRKKFAFAYLMILYDIIFVLYIYGPNYNYLAITFVLLGILLILKEKSSWLAQGIIVYLVLFTKQNIGAFYFLAVNLIEIILNGLNRKTITKLIKQNLITLLFVIINLFIFYIQGILGSFIDFTVLGIGEFTHNFHINFLLLFLLGFNVIVWIFTCIVNKKKLLDEKTCRNLIVLSFFSTMLFAIVYPIANQFHICLAAVVLAITVVCIVHLVGINNFNLDKLLFIIGICFLVKLLIVSGYYLNIWRKYATLKISPTNPYYGSYLTKEGKEKLDKIDAFIIDEEKNGNNVIILSDEAAFYFIPLKINNGIFDLPFLGNLGKQGEDGLIRKLTELEKNNKILIKSKKEDLFWQESEKANEYVRNNFNKVGEIADFEIYE